MKASLLRRIPPEREILHGLPLPTPGANTPVSLPPAENTIRLVYRDASPTKPAPGLETDCIAPGPSGVVVTSTPTPAVLAVQPFAPRPDKHGWRRDARRRQRLRAWVADVVLQSIRRSGLTPTGR